MGRELRKTINSRIADVAVGELTEDELRDALDHADTTVRHQQRMIDRLRRRVEAAGPAETKTVEFRNTGPFECFGERQIVHIAEGGAIDRAIDAWNENKSSEQYAKEVLASNVPAPRVGDRDRGRAAVDTSSGETETDDGPLTPAIDVDSRAAGGDGYGLDVTERVAETPHGRVTYETAPCVVCKTETGISDLVPLVLGATIESTNENSGLLMCDASGVLDDVETGGVCSDCARMELNHEPSSDQDWFDRDRSEWNQPYRRFAAFEADIIRCAIRAVRPIIGGAIDAVRSGFDNFDRVGPIVWTLMTAMLLVFASTVVFPPAGGGISRSELAAPVAAWGVLTMFLYFRNVTESETSPSDPF